MATSVETKQAPQRIVDYVITEEEVKDLKPVDASRKHYRFWKRLLDIILSFTGLLILLLPMLIIALIAYIDDPGNIIFSQKRIGRGGKEFRLYKFRTMRLDTPKYMATSDLQNPEQYITRVGKILRKLSLDEIPQLVNVLKGDMSLIGPRPLIPSEIPIHEMRTRFGVYTVRPGVTGLAQINGRDTVLPGAKVRYDVKYVEKFGIGMDLKIIFSTIPKVFAGSDVVEGKTTKK